MSSVAEQLTVGPFGSQNEPLISSWLAIMDWSLKITKQKNSFKIWFKGFKRCNTQYINDCVILSISIGPYQCKIGFKFHLHKCTRYQNQKNTKGIPATRLHTLFFFETACIFIISLVRFLKINTYTFNNTQSY